MSRVVIEPGGVIVRGSLSGGGCPGGECPDTFKPNSNNSLVTLDNLDYLA